MATYSTRPVTGARYSQGVGSQGVTQGAYTARQMVQAGYTMAPRTLANTGAGSQGLAQGAYTARQMVQSGYTMAPRTLANTGSRPGIASPTVAPRTLTNIASPTMAPRTLTNIASVPVILPSTSFGSQPVVKTMVSQPAVVVQAKAEEPANPSVLGRFPEPWWRKYDKATDGYVDSLGFMNRLPLRLAATNLIIHGLVDADKMWNEFDNEPYQPVLVGGKAIMTIFLNNFTDTDCGGSYLESWYNTVVTPKDTPQVTFETPDELMDGLTAGFIFLIRVCCGDAPGNPGAAMKAIAGGRGMFGFPKHPQPGNLRFDYMDDNTRIEFDLEHDGQFGAAFRVTLPGTKQEGEKYPVSEIAVPLDLEIPPEGTISSPILGGTHRGQNGSDQRRFAQHLCCTHHVGPWDSQTDIIQFGDDLHYAGPISRWDFVPVMKAHVPDFKVAAFKPNAWISGPEADEAVRIHEERMLQGVLPGAL